MTSDAAGRLAENRLLTRSTRLVTLKPLHRGRVDWGVSVVERPLGGDDWLIPMVSRAERARSPFPDVMILTSHAGREGGLAALTPLAARGVR